MITINSNGTIGSIAALEMLMHMRWSPEPFRNMDAPAHVEALEMLLSEKMVEQEREYWQGKFGDGEGYFEKIYRTTDRGNAYIEYLISRPFPVMRWEVPESAA